MIYLMRHGADDDSRLGGWSNYGLTTLGVEQVSAALSIILSNKYNISRIISSDLPRAKETAEIIATKLGLKVIFQPDFREINNGILAGMLKEDANNRYPGLYYSTLEWDECYPEGESPKMFYQRITNAWNELKQSCIFNENTLLVTHGGVIDIILCNEKSQQYTNKSVTNHSKNAEIISAAQL